MRYMAMIAVFLAVVGMGVMPAVSQEKIRILQDEHSYPNQPIEIAQRSLGDKPFRESMRVVADRDWLKQLVIDIKNVSEKTIRSVEINILVKERAIPILGFPIRFSTYTKPNELCVLTSTGERKLGPLLPGETVKVRIDDHAFTFFNNELIKRGIDDVDHAWLDVRAIYFEDGSRWVYGSHIKKSDP